MYCHGVTHVSMNAPLHHYAFEIRWVTPEDATQLLAASSSFANRKLDATRVRQLVAQIRDGQYRLNPADAVCINTAGAVVNGQHRLQACIDSGVPIPVVIVRDVPDDVVLVIDRGKARTPNDTIKMANRKSSKYASKLGPLITALVGYSKDPLGNWTRTGLVSSQDISDFLQENEEELLFAVLRADTLFSKRTIKTHRYRITSGDISLFLYLALQRGHSFSERLEPFIQEVLGYAGKQKSNAPTTKLFNHIIKADGTLWEQSQYRSKRKAVLDNMINVFNAWSQGECWPEMRLLTTRGGCSTPEFYEAA